MCESVVESRTNVTNKIKMYVLTNLCSAPGFSKTTESEETSYLHTYFLSFYYIFTCMCMHMCGHVHTMTHTSKSEDSLWEFVLGSQDSVGSLCFDYPSATLQWCKCELERLHTGGLFQLVPKVIKTRF